LLVRQAGHGVGQSALRFIIALEMRLDRLLALEQSGGLTARASRIAPEQIETDRTHGCEKKRAILDRMLSPPEAHECFLDDVFGVGTRSHPLPGEKNQPGRELRKTFFPIFMANDIVHDLFTVF
jgi:hypothetical protein